MADYAETLAEAAGAADDYPNEGWLQHLLEESSGAADADTWLLAVVPLEESAAAADVPSSLGTFQNVTAEAAGAADDYPNTGWFQHTAAESCGWADVAASSYPAFAVSFLMSATDGVTANWAGSEVLAEALGVRDGNIAIKWFADTLAEGVTAKDASTWLMSLLLEESFRLAEQSIPNLTAGVTLAYSVTAADGKTYYLTISPTTAESLGATDAVTLQLGLENSESLHLADVHAAVGTFVKALAESIAAADDPVAAFTKVLAETVGLADAHSLLLGLIMSEGLTLAALCSSQQTAAITYAQSLGFGDENLAAWAKMIAETAAAKDTVAAMGLLLNSTCANSTALADSILPRLTVMPTLSESAQLDVVATCMAIMQELVEEGVSANFNLTLDGSVWMCVVLNGQTFEPSVYSDFDFRSYCQFNGTTYAADDTGIYQLVGDTDDGDEIRTTVQWGAQHFGTLREKRIRKASLGVIGTHPAIKVDTENGGETFLMDNRGNAFVSRSVHGKRFTVAVRDFDELEFIELVPVILTR